MKRQTLFLMVCVLLVAGCSKKPTVSVTTTAGTKEPITFTFYDVEGNADKPWSDPVALKIKEATGVTIVYQHPVGGENLEQIPLMIASGDYPDLIHVTFDLPSMIDAQALIPLDDLIEKRGEHIKALYGDQMGRNRNSLADPQIYALGHDDVHRGKWDVTGNLQIQHAVLKDLGYPKMETLDDIEKALKAYKEKYPTINGQPTLGLSFVMPFWWLLQVGNASMFMIGQPDNGEWIIESDTLNAYYKYLYPGMDIYSRWLNKMYNEGLFDPESFTQTFDEYTAKIASGRVLAVSCPSQWLLQARQSLINDGMPERTYAPMPIVASSDYQSAELFDPGFSVGWGISITKNCKDPERALEFIDWLCSEEAQVLLYWGIEGVNYTVENGKRIVSDAEFQRYLTDPDYPKTTGVTQWTAAFPAFCPGYIDSTGNFITTRNPDIIKRNYLDVEKETLAAYGAQMWTDLYPPAETLGR